MGLHRRCTKVFVGRFRLEEDANPKGNADTMTVVLVTEALADYMRGEMQISLPEAAQDLQMLFVFKHLTPKEYECTEGGTTQLRANGGGKYNSSSP